MRSLSSLLSAIPHRPDSGTRVNFRYWSSMTSKAFKTWMNLNLETNLSGKFAWVNTLFWQENMFETNCSWEIRFTTFYSVGKVQKSLSVGLWRIPINPAPVPLLSSLRENTIKHTSEIMTEVWRMRGIDCYCPSFYLTILSNKCISCPIPG